MTSSSRGATQSLQARPVRVIYVMGLWRSGSTVLDIVLGNHDRLQSVGELRSLPLSGWSGDEACSCGEKVHDCAFWKAVRAHWIKSQGKDATARLSELQGRFERTRSIPRLMAGAPNSGDFSEYGRLLRSLYEAIVAVSGKDAVVDSTKYPARALALSRTPGIDLRLLHLVRDGRAVIWSMRRKANTDLGGREIPEHVATVALRTTFQWLVVNYLCDALRRRTPDRSLLLRYEDLVQDTNGALARIGQFVGLDTSTLAEKVEMGATLEVGHLAAGNRMRSSGNVRLRADLEWRDRLPSSDRRIFWWLAGRLARRYGYEKT